MDDIANKKVRKRAKNATLFVNLVSFFDYFKNY